MRDDIKAGDDAAVQAVDEMLRFGYSAKSIIAAIRDGKVPTVYCYKTDFHDLWQAAEKDLAALRARCEALERDLTSNVALVKSEVKNAQRAEAERDAAIARLVALLMEAGKYLSDCINEEIDTPPGLHNRIAAAIEGMVS